VIRPSILRQDANHQIPRRNLLNVMRFRNINIITITARYIA